MNLKRIIREEINDFSDSFYLIVSSDEKFIYKRNYMGGMKWEKVDNLTPKEIVNSDFLTYKAAGDKVEVMKRWGNDLPNSKSNVTAKVVSMDFILRKRDENFPMMESNDMDWINDIQSNKDIAEELFNQTIITKDKGIVKLPFTWTRQSPKKPYFDLSIKKKYGKDKDSDDIWERYKVLVNNRLKEITGKGIKESNDMEWINDINPIPEIKIGTCFVDEMSGVLKGGKWVIKSIREKPSVTIIEVVNSKGKSVTLNKKYFEEDLLNGRYKGCTESIDESNDMGWIHSAGQNKILTINKLKELFKKNNIDVDWDIEYDRSADGHGEYNEYFGKFYYDRENPISYNESYFIELYEKENGHLFFQLYRYDEEDDKYYRDEVYSQIETSSKNPEKFWRTVGWLVLYQMGKIAGVNGEETFDVENTIEESNDMGWVDESMPTLNDALYNRLLKVGDIVTLSGKLVDLEHKKRIDTDNFKVKIEKLGSLINSSDFTPLQKEYWGHLGYMDEPLRFAKEDGEMSVVSIE